MPMLSKMKSRPGVSTASGAWFNQTDTSYHVIARLDRAIQ
jgi:hypothetical protein